MLVGVDEYPKLAPHQQLRGCVNDAELMAAVLRDAFGFTEEGITLLRDGEASRDGILAAWNALVERAGPDDVVVLHYSGHGSQMTDREGDEPDGLDETIVPADSGRGSEPNRDITDDEVYELLTRLTAKTPLVTLIFDCCHSGTVTRDVTGAGVRRLEPDRRPVEALPPSPVGAVAGTRGAGPSGWLPPSRRYTLLAGCRDEELSHEHVAPHGRTHGALTWFLTQALARAQAGATYRDVFDHAALGVTAAFPSQHPQLEGAVDREVFGIRDTEPAPSVLVLSRAGAQVTLNAGAAQGVAIGSLWSAFAGAQPVGRLRVNDVGVTTSTALVVEEDQGGMLAPPARAVLERVAPDAPRLRVEVPTELPALAGLVDASPVLERGGGDARVLVVGPRTTVAADDPAPQLGPLVGRLVVVLGPDGRLLLPARPPDTLATVLKDLETVARYRRALAIENLGTQLDGDVDLTLLRRAADGTWVEATPEEAGGEVVFEVGEPLGLRIANRSTRSLYPAVLDLGLAYAVSVHGVYAGKEELVPGAAIEVGTRPGSELPLQMPDAFPFGGDADASEGGIEIVKLFVTTSPADYTELLQPSVRPATRALRDLPFAAAPPEPREDWTTVTRALRLRPRTAASPLRPAGTPVEVAGVSLVTPGLRGGALAVGTGGGGRTRAVDLTTDAFESVVRSAGLEVQAAIELSDVAPAAARSLDAAPPTIALRPAAPGPGERQLVLAKDEGGILTWHFAVPSRDVDDARREYRIERRVVVAPEPAEAATRGLAGAVASKLVKVLVFPLVEPAIGRVADHFAGKWEAAKRPYRLRFSTPDDFTSPGGRDVRDEDWRELAGKRTLLLVHGTFSRSHSGFGQLSRATFEDLYRSYGGRVLALDHFTLSHTPQQNVEWLLRQIPDATDLELDIVCHSRGGLVSRTLAERQSALSLGSRSLRVRRVIFVATPNAGTALADGAHLGDLLDTYTNVLNFVPDNGVTDVLEGIVTVAKMVAVGAMKGLDGLRSMVPDGEFQRWLNAGPKPQGTTYCALAADYEPTSPALRGFIADAVMDTIFKQLGNDLVVPTDGVYAANGAASFPIADRHVFAKDAGVVHTNFFANRTAQDKLLTWLGAP
ncbi:caspase family protein [Solirubrobacter phytolaccae]|uniref:Caspase family protein n=1 Tax=Solirubrobacter phytolaccae TaxID=1404360 RepID=A0A9X3N9F2_9ACTN|nr:caspase family protein [Solirubrobacter phytolaccae]MDA0181904.1 caspase family protein [Solirubrobacter phytolaccae]